MIISSPHTYEGYNRTSTSSSSSSSPFKVAPPWACRGERVDGKGEEERVEEYRVEGRGEDRVDEYDG